MLGFVIQRVLQAALVMAAMSALVFVGVYAVGNPIDVLISPDATQDIRAQTIARYGLDRPLYEQYFTFLGNILSGDMGRSFVFGMPVLQLIMQRLPATLELTLVAVIAATLARRAARHLCRLPPRQPGWRRPSWRCRSSASRCRPSGSG